MKPINKIVVAIGVLDIGYILWLATNYFTDPSNQTAGLYDSLVSFGLPYPELQFSALLAFYASILLCGISLTLNSYKLVWLNYAQFPIRVLLVAPTLYPVFYLLSKAGVELNIILSLSLLIGMELGRIYIIYKWSHITSRSRATAQ